MPAAATESSVHRVGLVVNPERTELHDAVRTSLRDRSIETVEATVDDSDLLGRAVDELLDRDVQVVAAIGGDGTQRSVAARLAATDVPLGVIPGGTVNLLGRVLGIHDVDGAVDAIVGGANRLIDLGAADDDPFVLNASTGLDAAVIARVDDAHKRFGRLGYFAAGVRQWFDETPAPVRISVDGEPWFDDTALTVIVLNAGQRGSERLDLAPESSLSDGRLDVVVVRRRSVSALTRSALSIVRRTRPDAEDFMRAQGAAITVSWASTVAAQRDGDDVGYGRAFRYRALPGALRVCVPPGPPVGASSRRAGSRVLSPPCHRSTTSR